MARKPHRLKSFVAKQLPTICPARYSVPDSTTTPAGRRRYRARSSPTTGSPWQTSGPSWPGSAPRWGCSPRRSPWYSSFRSWRSPARAACSAWAGSAGDRHQRNGVAALATGGSRHAPRRPIAPSPLAGLPCGGSLPGRAHRARVGHPQGGRELTQPTAAAGRISARPNGPAGLDPDIVRVPGQRRAAGHQGLPRAPRGALALIPPRLAVAVALGTYRDRVSSANECCSAAHPARNHTSSLGVHHRDRLDGAHRVTTIAQLLS